MTSILKYPGAKWGLASWVISFFPEHHSYLEAFLGSAGILCNKPRSNIETVNDLDGEVINLFDCICSDPERLAREIYYTPYARKIYEEAYISVPTDKFDRAKNFFIRCNMGHGFRTNGEKVGWKNDVQSREKAYAAKSWCELPERLLEVAERFRGVQIDNRPAAELIPRFNHSSVLIYCDPPYLLGTRHGKQYKCEMTDKDHSDLLEVLKAHKGPALISGYESDLYNSALQGWHKEYTTAYSQVMSKKREVLWMNYDPPTHRQLDLYGGEIGIEA